MKIPENDQFIRILLKRDDRVTTLKKTLLGWKNLKHGERGKNNRKHMKT